MPAGNTSHQLSINGTEVQCCLCAQNAAHSHSSALCWGLLPCDKADICDPRAFSHGASAVLSGQACSMDSVANGVSGFLQRPRVARHATEAILVAANLDAPPMYRFGACQLASCI